MRTALETLEAEVLQLSASDRSHLLERLIISLDTDPAVEQAWELEADRREAELDSGAVQPVPGEEMMARLRARLGRHTPFTQALSQTWPMPPTST